MRNLYKTAALAVVTTLAIGCASTKYEQQAPQGAISLDGTIGKAGYSCLMVDPNDPKNNGADIKEIETTNKIQCDYVNSLFDNTRFKRALNTAIEMDKNNDKTITSDELTDFFKK